MAQKTILIVEDDEALLRALCERFGKEGFRFLTAKDGDEGLKIIHDKHPDIILLDIIMPKMDGLTMLKKLRVSSSWGKNVPVLVLTNLTDPTKEIEAAELNISGYLVKTDWTLEDLVKEVKEELKIG